MKSKTFFTRALLSLIMLLLLCFPGLSLEGARKGLLLWYQTVLPTLLPFMVCTNLVISSNTARFLTAPVSPLLSRLLGLSENGCFILLNGILCGYPMGAKSCSDFLDQGCISLPEAKRLYAVSSFPSPMFLAGFVMAKIAQAAGPGTVPFWKIAASIYLPILPISLLAAAVYGFPHKKCAERRVKNQPAFSKPSARAGGEAAFPMTKAASGTAAPAPGWAAPKQPRPYLSLDEALMSSVEVMVKIGGYLMIFSILAAFLKALMPSGILQILLISLAEMTTGIQEISVSLSGTGILSSGLILTAAAFGGFSSVFQVKSVTKNVGLSIRHYILWKIIHGLLAWGIFYVIMH